MVARQTDGGSMYRRLALTVLTLLVGVGASALALSAGSPSVSQGTAASAPSVFQLFYQGPIFPEERLKAVRDALPYESLTLERSGGMVIPGGLFKLRLRKDGTATLWTDGGNRFGRAGEYVGTVPVFDYAKIN